MWRAVDAESARTHDWRERPEMLLGTDFLKAHRVLFAMSQQLFYFSCVGGEVFGSTPELLRRNDVAREQPAAAPNS
jgi:hypothetical protein